MSERVIKEKQNEKKYRKLVKQKDKREERKVEENKEDSHHSETSPNFLIERSGKSFSFSWKRIHQCFLPQSFLLLSLTKQSIFDKLS